MTHLIARAGAVDMLVQAIMKKIVAIASPKIRRTNPDDVSDINGGIGSPGQFVVRREAKHVWEINVPTTRGGGSIRCSILRQKVVILIHKQHRRQTPLLEIVQTLRCLRFLFCFRQSRQKQSGENRNDRNDHEQFNQREGVKFFHRLDSAVHLKMDCWPLFYH